MRIAACLLLAAAACGSKPAPATTTPANQATTAGAATPCPTDAALAQAAIQAWGKNGGTATATCVALHAGDETLWLIDGWYEPAEGGEDEGLSVGMWSALVTPTGEVRWADGDDELPYGAMMKDASGGWEAVDLDGDGTDEVLHDLGYNHGGYYSSSLIVGRIVGGKLVYEGDEIPLSNDNSAADPEDGETYSCQAAWKVLDGEPPKKVAIDYQGDCEAPGRHVYQWRDGKLVEVGALP